MTSVLNMRDRPDLRAVLDGAEEHGDVVRIDRRTSWGNPFLIGRHGGREEVIERYRAWLWNKLESGEIPLAKLAALNGKKLACWCHPQPCHGDVLAKAARWAHSRVAADMTQQTGSAVEAVRGAVPTYAGVGARKTPERVLEQLRDMATNLAAGGWHLRTGGAKGADDAFARAVATERRTVFIPWHGYNGWSGPEGRALTAGELQALRATAAPHHPAWQNCAPRVRDLHARNVAILLGADMREPVNAMVCWTENGRIQGGTGMAVRLAQHYRIPVLNLATLDVREAMDRLDRIAETHSRRDVERERALAGRTPDRTPSEAPRPAPDKSDKDWWCADGERQVQAEQSRSVTRQRSMHL
ncbi:MAG: DUF4326 domain-containing protein [Alphaproteobacteria bacterium]|nr:DUF4326 domain-containing protein [Alphaproteobacteria bacterium]